MKLLLFLTLFSSCFAANYQRDFQMPIAAAAYSDGPSQCWSKIINYFPNDNLTYSIFRQYSVKCESLNDTCSAYIAINTNYDYHETIYIAFRGTNNNYSFIENGWDYDEMVPFVTGGKVSKVFFDAFNVLWNAGMKDDLLTLKNKYPHADFYFTGHSIGGAMAVLAAATFKKLSHVIYINHYSFGEPRVGDKDFADALFDKLSFSSHRYVHKADIVPHLPSLNESVYYHQGWERWYNNDMGVDDHYIACQYPEDPECSNSLPAADYNMENHKYYYGRDFIEYGKNGCFGLNEQL